MSLEKAFNQYLSNLAVWNFKLHNIHWNVQGTQFVPVHLFTEEEYEKAFERFDDVAEHMKKFDTIPASTLKEYLELATMKEEPARFFTCDEACEIVLEEMKNLRKEATELRNQCDEENWFSAVSMFEDHIDDYNKQIWFLKSMLSKNKK